MSQFNTPSIATVTFLLATAVLAGGCDAKSKESKEEAPAATAKEKQKEKQEEEVDVSKMKTLDIQFGLYADMPDDWGATKRFVSFRDKSTETGTAPVEGAKGWVVGPKDERGNIGLLEERLGIQAVPKDQAAKYEKDKWDRSSEKWKEVGDWVIFVEIKKPDDADTMKAFKSLTYKP
jgi:hypothetical protein